MLPLLFISSASTQSPANVANELLEADRRYAAASRAMLLPDAMSAMWASDVIVPAPGGVFLEGAEKALAPLRANAAAAASRASWTPIRVGVSADGLHGFTFGFMTITRPDSTKSHWKYMAYWVKRDGVWRAQVYKRAPREIETVDTTMMPASLPAKMQAPITDAAIVERHRASLAAAEAEFSREAQTIGLGAAFTKFGSPDAVNMGPPKGGYLVGASAIGASIGEGESSTSSPVSWAADYKAIVASSGDLGVTIGFIRQNQPSEPARPPFPFFTIWRRPNVNTPWRYIAE